MAELSDFTDKRIVVEIVGGDTDGRVIDSDTANDSERFEIHNILHMTNVGELGRSFYGVSGGWFQRRIDNPQLPPLPNFREGQSHMYTVDARQETETELRIRLRHSVMHTRQKKQSE